MTDGALAVGLQRLTKTAATSFALALLTQVALAEETHHATEHAAEHAEHGSPWAALIFTFINFLLFAAVLRRYVWPPIKTWIRERQQSVMRELEAAAAAKQEAEELRRQWQTRMANLDSELDKLRADAQADIARERERILEAARKAAESIQRDAEKAAAAELRRVQEQLRAELVQAALRLATEATRSGWSADDQQRSIGDFLKQVN